LDKRIIVAIDGPAGAGKSMIARRLAAKLGFVYIDTGAMYRTVALWASRLKVPVHDMHRLEQLALAADIQFTAGSSQVLLNGEDVTDAIRTAEISSATSEISAIGGVRRALVEKQQAMAAKCSVVMEGRDIGTVVFPLAEVKIFLDADQAERAQRRVDQSGGDLGQVKREILDRDRRDSTRKESPLMQAPDATYIDTTGLTPDEVEQAILKIVRERTSNGKEVTS
jgi:cytidylate kinase